MPDMPLPFDKETWQQLPSFFDHLPEPVRLRVWADEQGGPEEREAIRLVKMLSERFARIGSQILPRKADYPFYPVLGVLGLGESGAVDHGLRFIGLPSGVQMTSLIAAVQCVAFQGSTSEARTRIYLARLADEVRLELITTADDEAGTIMAQRVFNMAVVSPEIRSYLIMGDAFPQALVRYSINRVPHLVINGRVHVEGVISEEAILQHIATAVRP